MLKHNLRRKRRKIMAKDIKDKSEAELDEKTPPEAADEKPEERPEVRFAAEAVAKAKFELAAAERMYKQVRETAVRKIGELREGPVGEAIDETRCFREEVSGPERGAGQRAGVLPGSAVSEVVPAIAPAKGTVPIMLRKIWDSPQIRSGSENDRTP
jgi:hypothetical protein